jgi:L-threonylcarbamoyladenylate synthase
VTGERDGLEPAGAGAAGAPPGAPPRPRVVPDDDAGRAVAIEALRSGSIVALPTDTVYGIAVALTTPGGIEALFAAKQRPPERGIALLIADAAQAATIAAWPPAAAALASAFWPGGLTIVVPQRADVTWPPVLTGGAATIGLRVPDHPAPRALAAAVGPLPTTSANRSGEAEAPDAEGILTQLGHSVALVLDGGRAHGGPASTVVDCTVEPPRIVRHGAISDEAVAAALEGRHPAG